MKPPSLSEVPQALSLGTHLTPLDGACLMEVVSVAAGQRWTDAPGCTHPLLGQLARLVNDASSPDARHRLIDYVPALVSASSDDPAVHPRLAMACIEYAMRYRQTVWLRTLHRLCERQSIRQSRADPDARGFGGVVAATRRAMVEHGAAPRAVEAAALALSSPDLAVERDAALRGLLEVGLAAVTGHTSSTRPSEGSLEAVGGAVTLDPAPR
jgi:hypothetical protein